MIAFTPRYMGHNAACSRLDPCPYDSPPIMILAILFALFSNARVANVLSMSSKVKEAYFGILDRNFNRKPAGEISSVVILSPTLMVQTPLIRGENGSGTGGSLMLGPRI